MPGETVMKYPLIRPAGDSAVMVVFGDDISKKLNDRVRSFDRKLMDRHIEGITETVPSYCADLIYYEPWVIGFRDMKKIITDIMDEKDDALDAAGRVVEIPVVYGGKYGPDLEYVASHNGLSVEEVIRIHSSGEYPVYMLGFSPGFPYLGDMDERIACPRLEEPRIAIPAGSVGIAGSQTGVYPQQTPGGWRIIGRTPLKLYDPDREKPVILEPGDRVVFRRIDEEEAAWD